MSNPSQPIVKARLFKIRQQSNLGFDLSNLEVRRQESPNKLTLYLNHLDAKYSKIDYMKRKKFTKYAQTKN